MDETIKVKTWRDVLADYRYLRATLNTLVQEDRQLSVEELVDSALNHDTMHGDTAMVILAQIEAKAAALDVNHGEREALTLLVERLRKLEGGEEVVIKSITESAMSEMMARYDSMKAALDDARANAEHYEDLYDWAKRWQSGRRENTRLKELTPVSLQGTLMAQVILQAKAMNEELDSILALLDSAKEPQ